MQPSWLPEAMHHLEIAEDDLGSDEQLLHGNPPHLRNAGYLAHQAAEKALKAFLAAHGQALKKTHDLELLLSECEQHDTSMVHLRGAVTHPNPYGVRLRYPPLSGAAVFDERMAQQAVQDATAIAQLIRNRIDTGMKQGSAP